MNDIHGTTQSFYRLYIALEKMQQVVIKIFRLLQQTRTWFIQSRCECFCRLHVDPFFNSVSGCRPSSVSCGNWRNFSIIYLMTFTCLRKPSVTCASWSHRTKAQSVGPDSLVSILYDTIRYDIRV